MENHWKQRKGYFNNWISGTYVQKRCVPVQGHIYVCPLEDSGINTTSNLQHSCRQGCVLIISVFIVCPVVYQRSIREMKNKQLVIN